MSAVSMLDYGAHSSPGRVRSENQDRALAAPPVFLVADGMGGHLGGAAAAQAAVDELAGLIGDEVTAELVEYALQRANARIGAETVDPSAPPGTTITGALIAVVDQAPYWMVINVGDSRTYLLRGGVLEQVTVDHSEVQELVDAGQITADEAEHHPRRNVITRALGLIEPVRADMWMVPMQAGDRLLACSDGVTKELADDVVGQILAGPYDSARTAWELVEAAVAAGGSDNATAVVVTAVADHNGHIDEDTVPIRMARQ